MPRVDLTGTVDGFVRNQVKNNMRLREIRMLGDEEVACFQSGHALLGRRGCATALGTAVAGTTATGIFSGQILNLLLDLFHLNVDLLKMKLGGLVGIFNDILVGLGLNRWGQHDDAAEGTEYNPRAMLRPLRLSSACSGLQSSVTLALRMRMLCMCFSWEPR